IITKSKADDEPSINRFPIHYVLAGCVIERISAGLEGVDLVLEVVVQDAYQHSYSGAFVQIHLNQKIKPKLNINFTFCKKLFKTVCFEFIFDSIEQLVLSKHLL